MNKLKKIIFKFRISNKSLKNKKGSELVESILMVGVAISLIVVIFYPQIMSIMDTGFESLQNWFENALSNIGTPII
jgi:competence protein ComGC